MSFKSDLFRILGCRLLTDKSKTNYFFKYISFNGKQNTLYSAILNINPPPDLVNKILMDTTLAWFYIKLKKSNCTYENLLTLYKEYSILHNRNVDLSLISKDIHEKLTNLLIKYPPSNYTISDVYELLNSNSDASYFTSHPIATFICKESLKQLLFNYTGHNDLDQIDPSRVLEILSTIKICEPSVGTGNFIISLLETYVYYYNYYHLPYDLANLYANVLKRTYVMDINANSIWVMNLRLDLFTNIYYNINQWVGDSTDYNEWIAFLKYPVAENTQCIFPDSEIIYSKDNKLKFNGFFDLVIANPPYVRGDNYSNFERYTTFEVYYTHKSGKLNLFLFCFEVYCNLLKTNGVNGIIIPDRFTKAFIYKGFRRFVLKKLNFTHSIILLNKEEFNQCSVYTGIFLFTKNNNQNNINLTYIKDINLLYNELNYDIIPSDHLTEQEFIISNDLTNKIIREHIMKNSILIQELGYFVNTSLNGGSAGTHVVTNKQRDAILSNCKDEDELKRTKQVIQPFIRYNKVKPYFTQVDYKNYIILIYRNFPYYENLNLDKKQREFIFKKLCPSLYNYLLKYKDKLDILVTSKRCAHLNWYELR